MPLVVPRPLPRPRATPQPGEGQPLLPGARGKVVKLRFSLELFQYDFYDLGTLKMF